MNLAAEPQFPTKWPFPPAPPARRAWKQVLSTFRLGRRKAVVAAGAAPYPSLTGAPTVVSAPAVPVIPAVAIPLGAAAASAGAGNSIAAAASAMAGSSIAAASATGRDVTLRQMIVDILLVAMWGAMIPALMWLGAAAGF